MQKSMIRLLSVADAISITNAIFGVLAILFLFSGIGTCDYFRIRASFTFIFLALLADAVARAETVEQATTHQAPSKLLFDLALNLCGLAVLLKMHSHT